MPYSRLDFERWKYDDRKNIEGGGIYILQTGIKIPKPFATDELGILYIGKSESVQRRLRIIKKGKFKEWYGKRSDETFDHSTLTFCLDFDDNHKLVFLKDKIDGRLYETQATPLLYYAYTEDNEYLEKTLLDGHVIKFGQLPCFNSTGSSLKTVSNYTKDKYNTIIKFYDEFDKDFGEQIKIFLS